MTARACRKCGAALGVDDETCHACGERNPVVHPWYVLPIGFVIVAVLFLLLVDIGALWRYLSGALGIAGQ